MTVFAIITEDGLDQFVETEEQVKRERNWLKMNGFTVKVRKFPNWQEAEAWEDRINGKG